MSDTKFSKSTTKKNNSKSIALNTISDFNQKHLFQSISVREKPEEEINKKLLEINKEINQINLNLNGGKTINLLERPKVTKKIEMQFEFIDYEQIKRENFMRERIKKLTLANKDDLSKNYNTNKYSNIKSKIEEYINKNKSNNFDVKNIFGSLDFQNNKKNENRNYKENSRNKSSSSSNDTKKIPLKTQEKANFKFKNNYNNNAFYSKFNNENFEANKELILKDERNKLGYDNFKQRGPSRKNTDNSGLLVSEKSSSSNIITSDNNFRKKVKKPNDRSNEQFMKTDNFYNDTVKVCNFENIIKNATEENNCNLKYVDNEDKIDSHSNDSNNNSDQLKDIAIQGYPNSEKNFTNKRISVFSSKDKIKNYDSKNLDNSLEKKTKQINNHDTNFKIKEKKALNFNITNGPFTNNSKLSFPSKSKENCLTSCMSNSNNAGIFGFTGNFENSSFAVNTIENTIGCYREKPKKLGNYFQNLSSSSDEEVNHHLKKMEILHDMNKSKMDKFIFKHTSVNEKTEKRKFIKHIILETNVKQNNKIKPINLNSKVDFSETEYKLTENNNFKKINSTSINYFNGSYRNNKVYCNNLTNLNSIEGKNGFESSLEKNKNIKSFDYFKLNDVNKDVNFLTIEKDENSDNNVQLNSKDFKSDYKSILNPSINKEKAKKLFSMSNIDFNKRNSFLDGKNNPKAKLDFFEDKKIPENETNYYQKNFDIINNIHKSFRNNKEKDSKLSLSDSNVSCSINNLNKKGKNSSTNKNLPIAIEPILEEIKEEQNNLVQLNLHQNLNMHNQLLLINKTYNNTITNFKSTFSEFPKTDFKIDKISEFNVKAEDSIENVYQNEVLTNIRTNGELSKNQSTRKNLPKLNLNLNSNISQFASTKYSNTLSFANINNNNINLSNKTFSINLFDSDRNSNITNANNINCNSNNNNNNTNNNPHYLTTIENFTIKDMNLNSDRNFLTARNLALNTLSNKSLDEDKNQNTLKTNIENTINNKYYDNNIKNKNNNNSNNKIKSKSQSKQKIINSTSNFYNSSSLQQSSKDQTEQAHKQISLLANCESSCKKASKLQKTMNKHLFIKSNLGKTYKNKKLKDLKEKIDYDFVQNIQVEREEKGLFIYGKQNNKNGKSAAGNFVKADGKDDNRKLDIINKMDDEAVYRVRDVLMQRFGISVGKVQKKKLNLKKSDYRENHEKVKFLLNSNYDMNEYLIRKIEKFQEDNINIS